MMEELAWAAGQRADVRNPAVTPPNLGKLRRDYPKEAAERMH